MQSNFKCAHVTVGMVDSSRTSNDTSIDFSPEHGPVVRCSVGKNASSSTRVCRQVDVQIPTQSHWFANLMWTSQRY